MAGRADFWSAAGDDGGSATHVQLALADAEQLAAAGLVVLFSLLSPAIAILGCKGPLTNTDQRQLSLSHHLWQVRRRPVGVVDDLVVGPVESPTCPRGSAVVGAWTGGG